MHEENLPQQQAKALESLNELLAYLNAQTYRERLNALFYAFLNSEEADYQETRREMIGMHYELIAFFTKMKELPLVDKYRTSVPN